MNVGKCTKTLFMCHCETGNIWTHAISSVYFIYHLIMIIIRLSNLTPRPPASNKENEDIEPNPEPFLTRLSTDPSLNSYANLY